MRLIYRVCILGSIAFLSSLFVLGSSNRTDRFILTIDGVKSAVVPILCSRFDEKGTFTVQFIDGTGFFIYDDGHFVTAAHVINDLNTVAPNHPIPCVLAVYIPENGWQREATTFRTHWFL